MSFKFTVSSSTSSSSSSSESSFSTTFISSDPDLNYATDTTDVVSLREYLMLVPNFFFVYLYSFSIEASFMVALLSKQPKPAENINPATQVAVPNKKVYYIPFIPGPVD